MSTAKITPWKTIAVGFIILTVAFGAVAGAAVIQMTALNNDKQDLSSEIGSLTTKVATDNQTIASLNQQITSLNQQVIHLQAELQANYTALQTGETTISQLQAQIANLQTQIAMLQQELAGVPRFTLVTGTLKVTTNVADCNFFGFNVCNPAGIQFGSQLSSIAANSTNVYSYSVYLPSATTYNVEIFYTSFGFIVSIPCTPIPSTLTTPSGTARLSQDFFC